MYVSLRYFKGISGYRKNMTKSNNFIIKVNVVTYNTNHNWIINTTPVIVLTEKSYVEFYNYIKNDNTLTFLSIY